ncbi:MAG: hypothetical protein ACREFC_08450, partial [Stellaceae bacterium]
MQHAPGDQRSHIRDFAKPDQHAAFGNVGSLTAKQSFGRSQFDRNFAGQAVVPSPVAGLALPQENRHPHLELFSQRDDALAVPLDGFAMGVRARGSFADFSSAFRYVVGKAQGF